VRQGKAGQVFVGLFAAELEAVDVFVDDILHVWKKRDGKKRDGVDLLRFYVVACGAAPRLNPPQSLADRFASPQLNPLMGAAERHSTGQASILRII
jgi:hypothetical protein